LTQADASKFGCPWPAARERVLASCCANSTSHGGARCQRNDSQQHQHPCHRKPGDPARAWFRPARQGISKGELTRERQRTTCFSGVGIGGVGATRSAMWTDCGDACGSSSTARA
jgi:hypothetical protein